MSARPFTLDRYAELLDAAIAGGYVFRGFLDGDPRPGDLFLRHDVDMSLSAALVMAELEHEREISATYFLMTESVFYNLASPVGRAALDRLHALGHTVGHHGVWPAAEPTLAVEFEPVLAWHTPEQHYMSEPVTGWTNVMDARFTGDFTMTYRSDSNQNWRRGDPLEDLRGGRFPWLQLLIHPELWVFDGVTITQTMDAFLDEDRRERRLRLLEERIELDDS